MGRVGVRFLLAVGVLAVCAQALAGAPAQFEVVERFAARLSEGRAQLQDVLSTEAVLVEHDQFVQVAVGPAANVRFRAWVADGVRLEVSFESASLVVR